MKHSFSFRFVRNLGMVILAGFVIASSLLSYVIMTRISADFKAVMDNQLPSLNSVIHIQSEFLRIYPHFQKFVNEHDDHYDKIIEHLDHCNINLVQIDQHASGEEKLLIEKLVKIIKQLKFALKTNREFVLYDAASSNAQELTDIVIGKMDDANTFLNDLSIMIQGRIKASEKAVASHVGANKIMLMAFMGMAVFMGIGIMILFNRALAKPINSLIEAADKIAQGDNFQLETVGKDEFAKLMKSFNAMSQKLVQNRTAELTEINDNLIKEIDDRKRAEAKLQAFAAKLEQNNKELQHLNFIASHDLREPLRKIRVFGDRLVATLAERLDDAKSRDNLEKMQGAIDQMHGLMDGLLMITRVTTKAQPFTPVDLGAIVRDVTAELWKSMGHPNGCVEAGDLPAIEADSAQMHQLFEHLIGNALKFHKKGEQPLVKISARTFTGQRLSDPPFDELCQITIEDNGIGFDDKYLDRIFGAFQQLNSRSEYAGTGMGLAVCKKIVERHNGSISAKSSPEQGTTLIVQLPVKQPVTSQLA